MNENIKICKTRHGSYKIEASYNIDPSDNSFETIKRAYRTKDIAAAKKAIADTDIKESVDIDIDTATKKLTIANAIHKLNNFLDEFNMKSVSARFFNTLLFTDNKREYLLNVAYLTNRDYISLNEKMDSIEFEDIERDLNEAANVAAKEKINKRFEIYYGDPGTGKTTYAINTYNCPVIVCNESMTPDELLNDFKFIDGKPSYVHSALYKALINGTAIILDEINKLPAASLYFIQTLTDNKKEIFSKERIKIADGFKIIGTMNVAIDGMFLTIPEALVDRCENIVKFELNENRLAEMLI